MQRQLSPQALIDNTRELWEPKLGRKLSDDECQDLIVQAKKFMRALDEMGVFED